MDAGVPQIKVSAHGPRTELGKGKTMFGRRHGGELLTKRVSEIKSQAKPQLSLQDYFGQKGSLGSVSCCGLVTGHDGPATPLVTGL
jgi:hypothetical protein